MNGSQTDQQSRVQFNKTNSMPWLDSVGQDGLSADDIFQVIIINANSLIRVNKNYFTNYFLKIDAVKLKEIRNNLSEHLLDKFVTNLVLRIRSSHKMVADDIYDIISMITNNKLFDQDKLFLIYMEERPEHIKNEEFFYLSVKEMRFNYEDIKEENKSIIKLLKETALKIDMLVTINSNLVNENNRLRSNTIDNMHKITINQKSTPQGVSTPKVAPPAALRNLNEPSSAFKRQRNEPNENNQNTDSFAARTSRTTNEQTTNQRPPINKQAPKQQIRKFNSFDIITDKKLWPRGIQIGKFKRKFVQPTLNPTIINQKNNINSETNQMANTAQAKSTVRNTEIDSDNNSTAMELTQTTNTAVIS